MNGEKTNDAIQIAKMDTRKDTESTKENLMKIHHTLFCVVKNSMEKINDKATQVVLRSLNNANYIVDNEKSNPQEMILAIYYIKKALEAIENELLQGETNETVK